MLWNCGSRGDVCTTGKHVHRALGFFCSFTCVQASCAICFSSSRVGDLQGTLQSHQTGSWVSERAESVCNVVLEPYRCCGRALGAKPLCAPHVARTVLWCTKEGKFHLISWNGSDYVGQVQDINELPELACVSFLPRRGNTNLYSWPVHADYSREPFTAFQREVHLHFVEGASSQRFRCFTIS